MNPGWLYMFRIEFQFYKFLFWIDEQAAYTKYQYDPDTIIYNQPSQMQEAKQTHKTKWYKKKTCETSIHEAYAIFHLLCQDIMVQLINILKYHLTSTFIAFYFIQFDWHRNMYFNKSVTLRSQF